MIVVNLTVNIIEKNYSLPLAGAQVIAGWSCTCPLFHGRVLNSPAVVSIMVALKPGTIRCQKNKFRFCADFFRRVSKLQPLNVACLKFNLIVSKIKKTRWLFWACFFLERVFLFYFWDSFFSSPEFLDFFFEIWKAFWRS